MRLFVLPALACALLTSMVPAALAEDTAPRGYATQSFTPKDFHLPEGAGCSGDIARWQAIQANDYAGGNVNLKVYSQIQNEIAHAAEACQAGRDGEASKMVSASKARHGYPQ